LAIKVFASLPILSPITLSTPDLLLQTKVWLSAPVNFELIQTMPRYPTGRHLLIGEKYRFGVLISIENGNAILNTDESGGEETKWDENKCFTEITIPLTTILHYNQRHILPIFGTDLILEDGLRCRYQTPLTKAKMWEIAFALSPLVEKMKCINESWEEKQKECIHIIRKCLGVTTFQTTNGVLNEEVCGSTHKRDWKRYCKDDVSMFAIHGQGHCHTVSSVMAAFLYPWQNLLAFDFAYREDEGKTHQWLEITCRPSMKSYVCDLYRQEKYQNEDYLTLPVEIAYAKGKLYPTEYPRPFSGYSVTVAKASCVDWT
jgi:hypothetical protein